MESIKAQRMPYSQIRVIFDRARELEKQGKEIIHLEIGRPDFNTPDHIVEAAIRALKEGKHHYCPNAGVPELRQATVAGDCFGKHGAGHIRLSYSNSMDNLKKAVAAILEVMK